MNLKAHPSLLSLHREDSLLFPFHRLRHKVNWDLSSAVESALSPQNHTQTPSDNTCLTKRKWLDYILVRSEVLRCRVLIAASSGLYTVVGSSLCLNLYSSTTLTWAPLVGDTLLRSQILSRGSLPMKVNSIKVYLLQQKQLENNYKATH